MAVVAWMHSFVSFFFLFLNASTSIILAMSILPTAAMTANKQGSLQPKQRIELFFRDPDDLRDRISFLQSHGFEAFNLVNKNQKDTLHEWVDVIRDECSETNADICTHYSLKYNKVARKGVDQHMERLNQFVRNCKADEILFVTGSGKTTPVAWNTVTVLERCNTNNNNNNNNNDDGGDTNAVKLACAYNPYYPDPTLREKETARLEQKLATGNVSKVYLQFGTDLDALKQALELLHNHNNDSNKNISIAGSVFLPTARLISQQKFRPWNGVFLSPAFLSGPETARAIVVEILRLYESYNVEILWEAPGIRTDKDVTLVNELLEEAVVASSEGTTTRDSTTSMINSSVTDDQEIVSTQTNSISVNSPKNEGGEQARKKPKVEKQVRSPTPGILLFGSHDVRLRDNRAVEQALRNHETVVPVFLWSPQQQGQWGVTGALQVVLKDALRSLETSLQSFGLMLVCRNCNDDEISALVDIVKCTGASHVYWNRDHTTESRQLERARREALQQQIADGVQVVETQSSLLYDPAAIELKSGFNGGHWGTLMPFLKNCKKAHGDPMRPTPYHEVFRLLQDTSAPLSLPGDNNVSVDGLEMAVIKGKDKWDEPIRQAFPMSEAAAHGILDKFFQEGGVRKYESQRSRADKDDVTSKLSPHLRIGTLSPNELYWRTEDSGLEYGEIKTFSRRLFWRELAYYQLRCFPEMRSVSIRSHYEKSAWVTGAEEKRRFEAWKKGMTGFPIVDAGMRELYATGWMTQSVRMVVASFLVEYLRVNWTKGCEWFHYTLVDADSAINAMMWQNAGKSGIDQWNFILSPVTASQDPSGEYTRKWIPELASLPTTALVHRPWDATKDVLLKAGVTLGETYPHRLITNLKGEREIAVRSTLSMRRDSQSFNTDRGYDLISLPDGSKTVVFTKKEYRIDEEGNLLAESASPKTTKKSSKKSRRRRR